MSPRPAGVIPFFVVCLTFGSEVGTYIQTPLVTQLDTYLNGRYDEAVHQAASTHDLGAFRLRWVQDIPPWIRADGSHVEQRRAAAAAFLLELTAARLESDWGRLADLIEVTCIDLRAGTPDASFERAWHRASLALAGRARGRLWLLGEYAVLPHQKPRRRPQGSKPDPNPKHLMHGLDRFPDDPILQLGRIVAWTWGRDQEPMRNLRVRDDESGPFLRSTPPREAVTALEPLTADPSVGAEALVRIAQLQLAMANPAAALAAADRGARASTGTEVSYLAHLLAGRALEALNRPAEAVERYSAALAVIPGAESATIALASLQFVHDDRERAVTAVSHQFDQTSATVDPGRLIGYGSYLHWSRLRTELRAALHP